MKHFVRVAILVAVLTLGVGFGLQAIGLMPELASAQGAPIDRLFYLEVWVISFLFALIVGFMLYSMIVFRRKPGEEGDGDHFVGHTGLEVVWTLVPLGIVMYFAFIGSTALAETRRVDPSAIDVTVVGQQWTWRFDYDDFGFSSTELVLPVNQQVLLTMISNDVIHSFWVPEFRVKQDVLPGRGMERELRVTPTEIGDYKVRCAELCGLEHAYMLADVKVVSETDYEAWIADQLAGISDDPVVRGEKWYQQFGCLACHSVDGAERAGPTWLNLYGSQETLTDESVITVDDGYIIKSILQPDAQIVQGYENVIMPPTGQNMSEQQIQDVVEFIKSLGE
jgi:cytochrome c oxidase subunit 2